MPKLDFDIGPKSHTRPLLQISTSAQYEGVSRPQAWPSTRGLRRKLTGVCDLVPSPPPHHGWRESSRTSRHAPAQPRTRIGLIVGRIGPLLVSVSGAPLTPRCAE